MSDVVEVVTETFVVDVAGNAGRGFTSRGAWAAGGSYAPYDVVTDGGETFENTVATSGSTPPAGDSAHWRLWAAKGADGASGSGSDALLKVQNLADLPSAAAARANLGLGTAATHPATDFDASGGAAAALASALAASQPVDADLTAIAALTTTSFGRSFLALADAAGARTLLALGTAATAAASDFDAAGAASAAQAASQPLDSDLTAIAALATTAYGRSLLVLANAAAGRTALALGTAATSATGDFDAVGAAAAAQAASQPLDSDLTAIAALSTTSYGRAFLALADAAAGRTALGLGTAATSATTAFDAAGAADAAQAASQPLDSDLTTIAALDASTAGALATDGAGWIRKTYAQFKTALLLVKGDVGLGNVDNTSDANKPVSTAQQTALSSLASEVNITDGRWKPTGAVAVNQPRPFMSVCVLGAAGVPYLAAVSVPDGKTFTQCKLYSGSTAFIAGTGPHKFVALLDSTKHLIDVSNDDTSTAWASNGAKTFTFVNSHTTVGDTDFYIAIVINPGSGGTMPTLQGRNAASSGGGGADTPVISGTTADTGLTTPATFPSTAGALTAQVGFPGVVLL